jgi:hypothetical protein
VILGDSNGPRPGAIELRIGRNRLSGGSLRIGGAWQAFVSRLERLAPVAQSVPVDQHGARVALSVESPVALLAWLMIIEETTGGPPATSSSGTRVAICSDDLVRCC